MSNLEGISSSSLETNTQPEHTVLDTTAAIPSAPVPDVLLSLAKDDRYISQITKLLSQSIVPITSVFFPSNPRNSSSHHIQRELIEDNGHKFLERIQPELHLLASILVHSAAFVLYTRQFGGAFAENNRGAAVRRSIGMESLNLAFDFERKRPQLVMNSNNLSIGDKFKASVIRAFDYFSMDRWKSLLLLQTIVPYLIQRAGRGGWSKDLGEITSSLFGCCGGGARLGTVENDEVDIRNDDRLRGTARRRLFEEQRRRMMNSVRSDGEYDSAGDVMGNDRNESSTEDTNATSSAVNNNRFVRRAKIVADFSWEFLRVRRI